MIRRRLFRPSTEKGPKLWYSRSIRGHASLKGQPKRSKQCLVMDRRFLVGLVPTISVPTLARGDMRAQHVHLIKKSLHESGTMQPVVMNHRTAIEIGGVSQVVGERDPASRIGDLGEPVPKAARPIGLREKLFLEHRPCRWQPHFRSLSRLQGIFRPSRGPFQEPTRLEHGIGILIKMKQLMRRRNILVRQAVTQINPQGALTVRAVESEPVVDRFVVSDAMTLFHIEEEDVDRLYMGIAGHRQRRIEANDLRIDAVRGEELCRDILDPVWNRIVVAIHRCSQRMRAAGCINNSKLAALIDLIKPPQILAVAGPADCGFVRR